MQVYTNSMGVEFCAIGNVVLRTGGGYGINISGITQDQLVNGIQYGIFTYHSPLTAKQYETLSDAIKCGIIK